MADGRIEILVQNADYGQATIGKWAPAEIPAVLALLEAHPGWLFPNGSDEGFEDVTVDQIRWCAIEGDFHMEVTVS